MAMKLLKLQMYPVYEIPEQIRRRIGFFESQHALDELVDVVAEHGDKATGSRAYQEALGQIVGFDNTPTGIERPFINVSDNESRPVHFAYNSRDTGVYNFVAIIVSNALNDTRTQETRYVVSGYTSQAERSVFNHLPDDMVLYINEIYGLQCTYITDAFGGRRINPDSFRLIDNYVLSKTLTADSYVEHTIDVISTAKAADMVRKVVKAGEQIELDNNTVISANCQRAPQLMSSQLTRPESFVTAISNSFINTMGIETELSAVDSFFAGDHSLGVESELSQIGVMRNFNSYELVKAFRTAISNATSEMASGWNVANRAAFKLCDLRNAVVNPTDVDAAIAHSLAVADRRGFGEIERTDDWVGRNNYSTQGSLVAFDLAMLLGPVVTRNLIGEVTFFFDNRMADIATPPLLQVSKHNVGALTEDGLPDVLARRFLSDLQGVFLQVTKHNRIRCKMTVTCIVGVVSRIEIEIDGELPEYYTHASFMKARLHCGTTTDLQYTNQLAAETAQLMNKVEEGYQEFNRGQNRSNILSNIPTAPVSAPTTLGSFGSFGSSDMSTPAPVTGFGAFGE